MDEVAILALVHMAASALNMFVKERWPVVGKIVNAFALGFGAAKPDPNRN